MTILMLFAGLAILVIGGEILVRGAVSIAAALGMSPLMIGLTIVGFGTSAPEMVASIEAALLGSPGVAVGNVVGSNICNVLLILGLTALIRPVLTTRGALKRDGSVLVVATVLCVAVALHGGVDRIVGLGFVALLVAYVASAAILDRRAVAAQALADRDDGIDIAPPLATGLGVSALMIGAGLVMLVFGAKLLVENAVTLAADLGVSESVIGLTVVAVGTSLPELVTSLVAVARGQNDVGFGNIVGSNIYNILGILGVTALVTPVAVPPEMLRVDIWVMAATTLVLLGAAVTADRVSRWEGGLMLTGYVAYVGWLAATARAGAPLATG